LLTAVLTAVRGVRGNPTLAAWFTDANAGYATDGARSSPVIEAMAAALLERADRDTARWLVRVVLLLLTMPGVDESDERRMLERFVVPALLPSAPSRS